MLASFPLQASFFVTADLASAGVSIVDDVPAVAGVLNATLACCCWRPVPSNLRSCLLLVSLFCLPHVVAGKKSSLRPLAYFLIDY